MSVGDKGNALIEHWLPRLVMRNALVSTNQTVVPAPFSGNFDAKLGAPVGRIVSDWPTGWRVVLELIIQ